MFKLLSTANPKIQKGTKLGYLSFILHLAPSTLSGKNTCPKATPGCIAACLNTAGRGGMFKKGENTNMIQKARIRKTVMYFEQRDLFLATLEADIRKAIKMAEKLDLIPVFRLNGTSDLSVEKWGIIEKFPQVQFYDYTKVLGRKVAHLPNYHLTFSKADGNDADVAEALMQGMSVVAVYDEIPAGVPSADETDLRFLDPKGTMLGLKAKGRAKKDYSGFVIRLKEVA
jgi:hypothetical protein